MIALLIWTAADDIAMFPKSFSLYGIKSEENAKKENYFKTRIQNKKGKERKLP